MQQLVIVAIIIASLYPLSSARAAEKGLKTLRQELKQQQQQLQQLKQQLDRAVDSLDVQASAAVPDTTLGGYGEMHYSNGDPGDSVDFHRFVLFVGHKFSDSTRFYSELELEHAFIQDSANGSSPGEVELEQAFVEHDFSATVTGKFGAFLMPVGIINETHEPTTFYGVERNPVEKNIIPATWWEGGTNFTFRPAAGWSVDAAITGGLNVPTSGANAYLIRKGRSKVALAPANNLAFTTRVKYTGMRGLELAATMLTQDDLTQGAQGISATLFSAHLILSRGPFQLRALYARWDLGGAGPKANGRDQQNGWYVEPSYRMSQKLGIFVRYNAWDNEAGNRAKTRKTETSAGVNYWLEDNVVLKADIVNFGGALDGNGFNLGVGYQF